MKAMVKKAAAIALAAVMCAGALWNGQLTKEVSAAPVRNDEAGTGVDVIPGADRTEKELDGSFLSVTGFAKGNVNDRSQYTQEDTEHYAVVTNEMEFFDAINDAKSGNIKVIEIRADLNLGWNELPDEVKEYYGDELVEAYKDSEVSSGVPVGNPSLIESGISTVTINNVDGLTIFSTTGNTIHHAEIKFNSNVNDVIIRNLQFEGAWEWDDWRGSGYGSTGGRGNRKRSGWTNIKLNGCKNVWIDHCTFGNAFDGNIDTENGSYGITISWCKIGDDDVSVGSTIYKTAMYLETLYQQSKEENSNVASFNIYKVMRDNGMSVEQVMKFMSQHDKAHLCGAGDKDSWLNKNTKEPDYDKTDANENIRLTFAYNYFSDIGQRLPMIRSGVGHLYNCYINDWDLAEVNQLIHSDPNGTGRSISDWISKAGGTCVTLARCIDARDGASIAADTCVYYGASTGITGTAYHPNGSNVSDGYQDLWKYNYALIVNSSFQKYGSDEVYVGSSWDNNGSNPFIEDENYWDIEKGDKKAAADIIGNWKWRQEGVNAKPDEDTDNLPYSYQTFPLEDVKKNIETYSGFRKLEMSAEDWLKTEYTAEDIITSVDPAKEIPIEELKLSKTKATLFMEEEFLQLDVQALPYNTTEKASSFTWKSSDEAVATVNDAGLVIPVSNGTTTITVISKDGKEASCEVQVTNLPSDIQITAPETIYEGDVVQFSADVLPGDLLDETVVWDIQGNNMEVQDASNGIFKALKAGKDVVEVTTNLKGNRIGNEGGISKQLKVTIAAPSPTDSGASPSPSGSPNPDNSPQPSASLEPSTAPDFEQGDVNEDGQVDLADVQLALRFYLELETPSPSQILLADIVKDGSVDLSDVQKILRVYLELE